MLNKIILWFMNKVIGIKNVSESLSVSIGRLVHLSMEKGTMIQLPGVNWDLIVEAAKSLADKMTEEDISQCYRVASPNINEMGVLNEITGKYTGDKRRLHAALLVYRWTYLNRPEFKRSLNHTSVIGSTK